MSSQNPYISPVAKSVEVGSGSVDVEPLATIARSTFLAWEKLRLLYIAVLAIVTLLLGVPLLVSSFRFWIIVAGGAVVANVCFFAGPIAETYATWLGFRAKWLRVVLFIAGTLFSCMLAFAAIAAEFFAEMD